MVTAVETAFITNLVAIFGGSPVLTVLFGLGVFSFFLFMLKLPSPILLLPLFAGFALVVSQLLPSMTLLVILFFGLILGYAIYHFWQGG